MRQTIAHFLAASLLLASALAGTASAEEPEIIARVGDEIITVEEFKVNLEYRLTALEAAQGQMINPDNKFQVDTLTEVIDARILRILAKNEGIGADPNTVQAEFQRGVARLGGQTNLPAYLKQFKLTEESLKEEIRQRLIMEQYIEKLSSKVVIQESEIEERFEAMRAQGLLERKQPTVDFAYVMTRPASQRSQDFATAKNNIVAAHERLKIGETPERVAADLSNDHLLPLNNGIYREVVPAEHMVEKIAEQLADMQVGDVTEPFMTGDGWHVIKLLQRNEAGPLTLDGAREFITSVLLEEKKVSLLQDTVSKAKNLIRVEIYPAELQPTESEE